jgi:hypothetical protein
MTNELNIDLHQQLRQLVQRTCSCPKGSPERQQHLDRLVREMLRSGKLWRDARVPQQDYEAILQDSWVYFCRNLCEASTAREAYNPERSSPMTWINVYIKMRLLNYHLESKWERIHRENPSPLDDGAFLDPLELIPSPPEIPSLLQEMLDWVAQNGIALRRVHVRDRPDINCQILILCRLPPKTESWRQLAQKFRISESTLQSFYRRKCLPELKSTGERLGYL